MKEYKGLKVSVFHADHAVSDTHLAWALDRVLETGRKGFFLTTLELPESLESLPCGLFGPMMGDKPVPESEVHWRKRSDDRPPSRLVERKARADRRISVIGIVADDEIKVFTTYGGPIAPREVFDPSWDDMSPNERVESWEFWGKHALAD